MPAPLFIDDFLKSLTTIRFDQNEANSFLRKIRSISKVIRAYLRVIILSKWPLKKESERYLLVVSVNGDSYLFVGFFSCELSMDVNRTFCQNGRTIYL
jgi:hypothetical protein